MKVILAAIAITIWNWLPVVVCACVLWITVARTSLTLGVPTVIEVRLTAQRSHILIIQSDGSVLWWRRTP